MEEGIHIRRTNKERNLFKLVFRYSKMTIRFSGRNREFVSR